MENTTLVALRSDTGETLAIGDVDLALLRRLSDERLLRCPFCQGLLTLKAGPVRLHHFAHTNLSECASADHEPETDTHRLGKYVLYRHFRQGARDAGLERWLPSTDQRADCYIQAADGERYALEFQQANNSLERWTERHRLYQSQTIHDVWFLGTVRYAESASEPLRPISPYDPLPVPRDVYGAVGGGFRVRELEKAILIAQDRLTYLDPESQLLTILVARSLHANTLRAYRYQLPLAEAQLRAGSLWTPLDPLLDAVRRHRS